jgi:hypothetical protein
MTIKANFGSVDISPIEECVMGCGDYKEPTLEHRDNLEANFVIISSNQKKTILISFDLLYIGARLRSEIANSLSEFFSEDQIFLAASHTHYAPMVDDSKRKMGEVNLSYLQRIVSEIQTAVTRSIADEPKEIKIKHHEYPLSQAVNRRRRRFLGVKNNRFHFNKYVMLPNFKFTDFPMAHLIIFEGNEIPLAVFWQFSCHPTSLPSGSSHSAHYIGEVRKKLRHEIKADIPLVFFQGFSGDLRPPAINANPKTLMKLLEKWIVGCRFRLFTEQEYEIWCESVSNDFLVNFRRLMKKKVIESIHSPSVLNFCRLTWPLDDFFTPDTLPGRSFSIHKIELNDLIILGTSAELVSKWESHFIELGGSKTTIGVSCIDDTFGYLPDQETMLQGGYEAGEYCDSFGLPPLSPESPSLFVDKLKIVFQGD